MYIIQQPSTTGWANHTSGYAPRKYCLNIDHQKPHTCPWERKKNDNRIVLAWWRQFSVCLIKRSTQQLITATSHSSSECNCSTDIYFFAHFNWSCTIYDEFYIGWANGSILSGLFSDNAENFPTSPPKKNDNLQYQSNILAVVHFRSFDYNAIANGSGRNRRQTVHIITQENSDIV